MTPTMKGFLFGVAAVAFTFFFGFGGGVLIAEWLSSDTAAQKQTRVERVKGTDVKAPSAAEISSAREDPKAAEKQEPEQNLLVPKKVVTETVTLPPAARPQPSINALPLRNEPLGPPQTLTRDREADATASPARPAAPVAQSPREIIREVAPAATHRPAGAPAEVRSRARPNPQLAGPELKRNELTRGRKQVVTQERRERVVETDGVAPREEMTSNKPKRTEAKRKTREATREDDDEVLSREATVEQRPAAPMRPLFGLFGL